MGHYSAPPPRLLSPATREIQTIFPSIILLFHSFFFLLPFLLLLRIYPISHELDPLSVITAVVIAVSGRVASRRSGLCLTVAFVGFLVGLVGVEDAGSAEEVGW